MFWKMYRPVSIFLFKHLWGVLDDWARGRRIDNRFYYWLYMRLANAHIRMIEETTKSK